MKKYNKLLTKPHRQNSRSFLCIDIRNKCLEECVCKFCLINEEYHKGYETWCSRCLSCSDGVKNLSSNTCNNGAIFDWLRRIVK